MTLKEDLKVTSEFIDYSLVMRSEENNMDEKQSPEIKNSSISISVEKRTLIYRVSETPPIYLTIVFALQQSLVTIPMCLSIVAILSDVVCARQLEEFKAKMFSTTIFLAGLCTFCQCTFGIRLPVYQGPLSHYVVPLLALSSLPEWKCPAHPSISADILGEKNSSFTDFMNMTNKLSYEDVHVLPKVRLLQGSLALAGLVHILIGATGVLGFFMRFIGPLTVVPTLLLVSIQVADVVNRFSETSWVTAIVTAVICLALAMYLDGKLMPIPVWKKGKGFTMIRYPLHKVISILLGIGIGWGLAAVLTVTNVLSSDPNSKEFYARTDSRLHVIYNSPWFYLPYPGQFGPPSFSVGIFVTFLIPTIVSVIDSIADYYACARTVKVPPPPVYAINRGIAVEGLFSCLAGFFGAGHATTTNGGTIGLIGMTKVASLRVFQALGLQMVLVSVIGKLAAFFVAIPYAVLGGTMLISAGSFIGLIFSNLCYVNIKLTRNLSVIGISVLAGIMVPRWSAANIEIFDTGIKELNDLVTILMTSPNFFGGCLACFLDNTLPGTLEDRGLTTWLSSEEEGIDSTDYEEGLEVYEIPYITRLLRKISFAKYIPFCSTFQKE